MKNNKKRILCVDATNLLYRTFFANQNEPNDVVRTGLAHHASLNTINKYYKQFKPNQTILAFDRPNWRKEYTKSDLCISKKIYKGNRRQNMTPKQKERFEMFIENISEFEELMKKHTKIITLSNHLLEADDLVAGVAEYYSKDNDTEVIIVSTDGDLLQVLKYDNVRLISPLNGKERTLEEYDNDPDWFMFQKCFRGDLNDNVEKALPGVRTTRLKKAYKDDYELYQLLNETWTNVDGIELKVGELFEENKLLMDLFAQPEPVKDLIEQTIVDELNKTQQFSFFHFRQFCGKYELKRILENVEKYIDLLGR